MRSWVIDTHNHLQSDTNCCLLPRFELEPTQTSNSTSPSLNNKKKIPPPHTHTSHLSFTPLTPSSAQSPLLTEGAGSCGAGKGCHHHHQHHHLTSFPWGRGGGFSFLLPPSSFLLPPSSFLLPPSSFLLPPSSFLPPSPSPSPLPLRHKDALVKVCVRAS